MSGGPDDRIVSMHFENANFQKGVGETLGTLDKLKQSLNFEGVQQGFSNIESAAGKVTLGHMSDAVEGVSAKFIALTTVAVTALSNITSKAVDAGLNFVKSFTVAPIQQGFEEYATKIGSIQTILANTQKYGTTLPQVTSSLNELSTYADKTIFSFGDMTKNIGLFTNAGIKVDEATKNIQGFSNVAAASGTTSEGAASAAYQLSQAMSAGTVRLMDWKSLQNVGMGNTNMQQSLVQIANAMGRFKETGDDAKDVQAGFNQSLESGWLDAKTMSTYLDIMAGSMSKAQVMALGMSSAQADALLAQQKTAEDAATKVRTFPQLMDTVRSTFVTGWSKTFEILVGNFDEATDLYTNISNVFGGFLGNISKARNELLQGWKDMGGRTVLLNALKDGFHSLGLVIKAVSGGLREIFPPVTAAKLLDMTKNFADFTAKLKPSPEILDRIKRTVAGVAAVFDIAKTVILDVIHVITHLIGAILPDTGSGLLGVTANAGDFLVMLDKLLVKGGKIGDVLTFVTHIIDLAASGFKNILSAVGDFFTAIGDTALFKTIEDGFKNVGDAVGNFFKSLFQVKTLHDITDALNAVKDAVVNFFAGIGKSKEAAATVTDTGNALGRIGDRAKTIADEGNKVLDFFEKLEKSAANLIAKALPAIGNFFGNLGSTIAGSFKSGSFDQVFDALNVGLLGGIALLLHKFFKDGLKLDLTGGAFAQLKETLAVIKNEVSSTFGALQTQLKAKALLEIAIAMGVLTAAVLVLSLIDSKNLTKSMVAMAVGFGELVGVMKLLDEIAGSGTKGTAKLSLLVGVLISLAGAAIVLTGAIALIGSMDMEQIGKGLLGITGALAILVGALKIMGESDKFTAGGSLAILGMAKALNFLASAVKEFGNMSMGELGKGLGAVGLALGMIVIAMNALPGGALAGVGLMAAGAGMILIATALGILVGVVKLFALLSVGDLAKGLIAMGIALGAMGLAMQLFPPWMPLIAIGMMLLVPALAALVGVIAIIGHMNIGTLVQGIGAMAAVLLVLAVGMIAMEAALPGAMATFIVAAAMGSLAIVIETLGKMSLGDIAKGIGAIAAVLAVLGIAALLMTPILPELFALGDALLMIGAAFALFGVGAYLAATAFEIVSKAGSKGIGVIIDAIAKFLKAIPMLTGLLLEAIVGSAVQFVKIGDMLVVLAGKFLGDLLKIIIDNVPKIALALLALITAGLDLIRGIVGDIVATGFVVLEAFLKGLRDHMDEVTQLAIDIISNMADTLIKNEQKLVDTAINLLLGFLGAIANRANDITAAGLNLLLSFLAGMINNLYRVIDFAVTVLITFAQTIATEIQRIIDAGVSILINLLAGVTRDLIRVTWAVGTLIGEFLSALEGQAQALVDKGAHLLIKFLEGLGSDVQQVIDAGANILVKFMEGVGRDINKVVDQGAGIIVDFINRLADTIRNRGPQLVDAFFNLADSIVDGLAKGLDEAAKKHGGVIGKVFSGVIDKASDIWGSHSPSRVFMGLGRGLFEGVAIGVQQDKTAIPAVVSHAERIVDAFAKTLNKTPDLTGLNVSPVITPVLDLSKVRTAAQGLDSLMAVSPIAPTVSADQAQLISTSTEVANRGTPEPPPPPPAEIHFTQNNYSPDALSTNDIYRNTKSQIALAKEELNIS